MQGPTRPIAAVAAEAVVSLRGKNVSNSVHWALLQACSLEFFHLSQFADSKVQTTQRRFRAGLPFPRFGPHSFVSVMLCV